MEYIHTSRSRLRLKKLETNTEDFTDDQFPFVRRSSMRKRNIKNISAGQPPPDGGRVSSWLGPLVPICRWRRMMIEKKKYRATCCSILLSATSSHIAFASTLLNWHKNFGQKVYYNFNCTHDGTGRVTAMPHNSLSSPIAATLDRNREKKKQTRMMATAFRARWLRRI